ncbi:hypothetical protein HOE04_03790 [archaeon]|jgi:hypothetical protein|nr:hypothetical protein [archaeon]
MSVYLVLGSEHVVTSWADLGGSEGGPIFGPLDSAGFLHDRIKVGCNDGDGFEFYFDDKGCIKYADRKYKEFNIFDEGDSFLSGLGLGKRLVEYDAELNDSLRKV